MKRFSQITIVTLGVFVVLAGIVNLQTSRAMPGDAKGMKVFINRYADVWNSGNLDELGKFITDGYVRHDYQVGMEKVTGVEGLKKYISYLRTGYPDWKVTFSDMWVEGKRVIAVWKVTGTNTGPLGNLKPTGKKIEVHGMLISRMAAGKIAEEWVYFNQLQSMSQVGFTVIPPGEGK